MAQRQRLTQVVGVLAICLLRETSGFTAYPEGQGEEEEEDTCWVVGKADQGCKIHNHKRPALPETFCRPAFEQDQGEEQPKSYIGRDMKGKEQGTGRGRALRYSAAEGSFSVFEPCTKVDSDCARVVYYLMVVKYLRRHLACVHRDCCAPGGLLERVYAALRIPSKSWAALKHLPEVRPLFTPACLPVSVLQSPPLLAHAYNVAILFGKELLSGL
jgi:hypothetical protein